MRTDSGGIYVTIEYYSLPNLPISMTEGNIDVALLWKAKKIKQRFFYSDTTAHMRVLEIYCFEFDQI